MRKHVRQASTNAAKPPVRPVPAGLAARPSALTPGPTPAVRDHLFINYASEDRAVAEWLTLKLTAAGYRVWCDRFKILGGERYPQHINYAIRAQTFRVLALISRRSLEKHDVSKERKLALDISKEREEDFVIPLDLEGLRPSDRGFELSDLDCIPFTNWASGLDRLLKKLRSLDAPRPVVSEGPRFAAETFLPADVLLQQPEVVYTNCFLFREIPARVHLYQFTQSLNPVQIATLEQEWAFHSLDDVRAVAFDSPPNLDPGLYTEASAYKWSDVLAIEGVITKNIVSNLLRQSLIVKLIARGLTRDAESRLVYFPKGAVPNDKLSFRNERGRSIPVSAVGARKFRGEKYRYHLAPSFRIRQDLVADNFVAQLKIRVYLTDMKGKRLEAAKALARRKHLAKNWFNHQWVSRQLAISAHLAEGNDTVLVSETGVQAVVLEASPIQGTVPYRINDTYLNPLRESVLASNPELEEDEDTEEAEV